MTQILDKYLAGQQAGRNRALGEFDMMIAAENLKNNRADRTYRDKQRRISAQAAAAKRRKEAQIEGLRSEALTGALPHNQQPDSDAYGLGMPTRSGPELGFPLGQTEGSQEQQPAITGNQNLSFGEPEPKRDWPDQHQTGLTDRQSKLVERMAAIDVESAEAMRKDFEERSTAEGKRLTDETIQITQGLQEGIGGPLESDLLMESLVKLVQSGKISTEMGNTVADEYLSKSPEQATKYLSEIVPAFREYLADPEKSYEAGVDQRQAELEAEIANDASARDAAEARQQTTHEAQYKNPTERTNRYNAGREMGLSHLNAQAYADGKIKKEVDPLTKAETWVNIATGEEVNPSREEPENESTNETTSSLYVVPQEETVFGNIDGMFGLAPNAKQLWSKTFGQVWPGSVNVESTSKRTLYKAVRESFTQAVNEDSRLSVDERRTIYDTIPNTGIWESDEDAKASLVAWHDILARRHEINKRNRDDQGRTVKNREIADTNMMAIESLLAQLGNPNTGSNQVSTTSTGISWEIVDE